MGEVTTAAEQTFNGHKVVITFGGQKREFDRFAKINKHNRQQRMKLTVAKASSVPVIQIIASFALAFVFYAVNSESLRESISAGSFVSVITYMTMLLRPLKMLTNVNSEFQKGMAACVSIFEVLDQKTERDQGTLILEQPKGSISFNNVNFSYGGINEQEQDTKWALKNISFETHY